MKRGTPSHPKTKRLCRCLDRPTYAAVGILESLWLFTAEYAPCGDIGRFSDQDIADAIGWDDQPNILVDGLVECGWIEKHETHRLVIHDWPSHADDATNLKLARARQYFWNGDRPRYTRMSNAERAEITKDYDNLCAQHAHGMHTACTRGTHENRPPSPPLPSPPIISPPLPSHSAHTALGESGGIQGNPKPEPAAPSKSLPESAGGVGLNSFREGVGSGGLGGRPMNSLGRELDRSDSMRQITVAQMLVAAGVESDSVRQAIYNRRDITPKVVQSAIDAIKSDKSITDPVGVLVYRLNNHGKPRRKRA